MKRVHEIPKPQKRLKIVLFTIFAVLFALAGLFLLESFQEGLLPWVTIGCPGCASDDPNYNVDLFRWFGAQHGALVGILFSGSLIALIWKPWTKPLLLQFYIIGHLVFIGVALPMMTENPEALPFIEIIFLTPIVILGLTYPGIGIWNNMFKQAEYHRPLLVLTFIALLFLLPSMWREASWQVTLDHPFSQYNRWLESFQTSLILIIAGILASTRKPGWKELTVLIGSAYIFLGMAAITLPDHEGSWGVIGGILSILGGIGYIGMAMNKFKSREIKSDHNEVL